MRFTLVFIFFYLLFTTPSWGQKEILYVGTYSVRGSEGIYVYEFNRARGSLTLLQTITTAESPTYLAIDSKRKFLYAVNRGSVDEQSTGGSVSSYRIHPKTGKLTLIDTRPSYGADPCHISLDQHGEYAFIAHYSEGNIVVLPLFENGTIGSPTDSKKYYGTSVNTMRQTQSHVHSSTITKDNRHVYVADLGTDKIYGYTFNADAGTLDQGHETLLYGGVGPRMMTLNASENTLYVIEELTSTVGILDRHKNTGTLTIKSDTIRSLPKDFSGSNTSSHLAITPNQKFLYVANRGADVITHYKISTASTLQRVRDYSSGGKTPRNFLIDSKGQFLLVGNQDSDTIVLFKINVSTGELIHTGNKQTVPSPACLKMISL
jgi:6-phosphogluconolactonase